MTKKRILYGILGLFALYLCYLAYIFVLSPKTNLQSIYLIPKDAVFILESQQPVESWKKVTQSDAWRHLGNNETFAALTRSIQKVDTVFNNHNRLFEFFDGRSLFISVHMVSPKDYGIFYVLDLKRIAKLQLLKTYLSTLLNEDYTMSKRQYHGHEILELYDRIDRETIYLAFIKNQLVASHTHSLVEASIDQYGEPVLGRELQFLEINRKVGFKNLFRLYVQHGYLDDYAKRFTDKPAPWISRASGSFMFSGFHFDLDPSSTLIAQGYTNIDADKEFYLEALQRSGRAGRSIPQIAPQRTALYISYGFDSFGEFHRNFEKIQQRDPNRFASYSKGKEQIENLLKIDIRENFVSWIGDEIALLQIQSRISKGKNELALVIKANDPKRAQMELDFVVDQVRRKTPVKFKAVDYKGRQINYLSIKGFFKILFGGRFDELDKPYFTRLGDYVVFSDDPNALKSMIDDVDAGQTLSTSGEFRDFEQKFDDESTIFVYGNVPLFYDNLYAMADPMTQVEMDSNKDYIVCFPQFGFQLNPREALFESRLAINYRAPEQLQGIGPRKPMPSQGPTPGEPKADPEAVFDLGPIYPSDLNAKSFRKNYPNGSLRFELGLKDGLKHGSYIEYHPNGQRKISGRFREDRQVGVWRYFDPEGKQIFRKRF